MGYILYTKKGWNKIVHILKLNRYCYDQILYKLEQERALPFLYKNIIMGVKGRIYIFLLTLVMFPVYVYSQEHSEFYFSDEPEDSLSSLTIVPIKKPKALLRDITKQLSIDLAQEPRHGKYEVTETYGTSAPKLCTSKGIVSSDGSLRQKNAELEGDFSFTGPYRLTPQDSSLIKMSLSGFPEMSPLFSHIESLSISDDSSILAAIRKMVKAYDVKVYRISDESGRSVYRVNFLPKKAQITLANSSLYAMTFYGVAFFDTSTLRLKNARTLNYINTKNPYVFLPSFAAPGLSFYPFYAKVASHDTRKQCRVDYESVDGKLVVEQMKVTIRNDNKTVTEASVRRLP